MLDQTYDDHENIYKGKILYKYYIKQLRKDGLLPDEVEKLINDLEKEKKKILYSAVRRFLF